MPLYEYLCDACGHRFEVIRKFSDAPLETCPKCGGHVQKLIASPAIQFKGSGWYITDYAKKGTVDASKSGDSKDGNSAGGDAKSDSKETGAKAGDSKSGDSKSADSKSPETKSSDSKSPDTKASTSSSS